MTPAEVREVLERHGAIQSGHFRLSSGRHSDLFVQKFRVLEHPRLAQSFGHALAAAFAGDFEVVASPAVGALILGFTTSLAADARFVFAERVEGRMAFRRDFSIRSQERVLIVEDVVTTGGSVTEVVDLVRSAGGVVAGVGALIDRCDPSFALERVRLKALLNLPAESWGEPECPLCTAGEPLAEPGSSRL